MRPKHQNLISDQVNM